MDENKDSDKLRLIHSAIIPILLVLLIWVVKFAEVLLNTSFSDFGIQPQVLKGLRGVIFSPLLHSDFKHLGANTIPLFVLSWALYYFYPKKATIILFLNWIITGFWVWAFAKGSSVHIGASGVIYALAGFHLLSGIIRKEKRMMAFTLVVVFLYGGLIWGVFPDFYPEKNISWESHLLGLLAGVIIAIFFKDEGLQKKEYNWDDDDDVDFDWQPNANENSEIKKNNNLTENNIDSEVKINYNYVDNKENKTN